MVMVTPIVENFAKDIIKANPLMDCYSEVVTSRNTYFNEIVEVISGWGYACKKVNITKINITENVSELLDVMEKEELFIVVSELKRVSGYV